MKNKDLDKWIAENVMGWTIIDELHIKDNNGNYVFDGSPWHPTESISDAFQVVEKMIEKYSYRITIVNLQDFHKPCVGWHCGIVQYLDHRDNHIALGEAETVPLAICRAAKAAIEEMG